MHLTARLVRSVACSSGVGKLALIDIALPGFTLEVTDAGTKTYYQRYIDVSGQPCRYRLGSAQTLSLTTARQRARDFCNQLTARGETRAVFRKDGQIPTFQEFVREYYIPFVRSTKRSWKTDEVVLRVQIQPTLGHLRLHEITTLLIVELLNKLATQGYAPGTINRVLVLLRYTFNLASRWNVASLDRNPTVGLKRLREDTHERYLSNDELRRLLVSLDVDENQIAARAIKLLILTGARRNEITHARWEYLHPEKRTLSVPSSKNGGYRLIALNAEALDVLGSLERLENNPFIFPSPVTGRPSPSLHFPWCRIRKRAGLSDVRLHDLRHSFASFLVNTGISLYVVQSLLGHTQLRTTQRYAHLSDQTLFDAADTIGSVVRANSSARLITIEQHVRPLPGDGSCSSFRVT